MTTPCLYSIVRYAPYAETEEFANIGVLLCAPKESTLISSSQSEMTLV